MTLAKIKDGAIEKYPVGFGEIKTEFPNTSFPKNMASVDLTPFGYVNVADVAQPTYDPKTEKITQGTPVLSNGVWVQSWQKDALSAGQIAEIKKATDDAKATSERNERNALLAATDYLALSDATLTDAMKTYRQALRDVPAQSGFPDNITWPTKP